MCCSSCRIKVFSMPRERRSTRRSYESSNDGVPRDQFPRDQYGKPLQNLVRKYPPVAMTNSVAAKK
ncbi:MAG: hypothetical protein LBV52_06845 [Spirochaetaceae bacterium]|jgi:hypothetical protein|nr:hypothetical protein [Spirochaetaceae bacterium]